MALLFLGPFNQASQVAIWHTTENPEELLTQLSLNPEDMARYEEMSNPNRKRQWLGCRLALKTILQTKELDIRYDKNGKPGLATHPGNISFSHCGEYAAAIYAPSSAVGIDLEEIRERIRKLASRFLSQKEMELQRAENPETFFTLCWSCKEAAYKIHGDPGIDLKHDIIIEAIDYLCKVQGNVKVSIRHPEKEYRIGISFLQMNPFIVSGAVLTKH